MDDARQTLLTRRFFDREAAAWPSAYRPGGHMADRIDRFLGAISAHDLAPGAALDVGCGSGEIAIALAKRGWRVTGCDLSSGMIAAAKARHDGAAVSWKVLEPGGALPFGAHGFDLVLSSSVLEYVEDPAAHLKEIARVLRPGGWYLATVPDMRHAARQAETAKRNRAANPITAALLRFTPWRGTYDYLRLSVNRFDLSEWACLFQAAGLRACLPNECAHPLALIAAQAAVP